MLVRTLGFSWNLEDAHAFLQYLSQLNEETISFAGQERLLYVGRKESAFAMLFVSAKDQRKICELIKDRGSFRVNVRTLGETTKVMDFNFAVINPETGRGVYQYYHGSCSIHSFHGFIASQHRRFLKTKPDEETEEPQPAFGYSVVVREGSLKEILQGFQRIKSFEFDLETIGTKSTVFTPLSPHARGIHHKIAFKKTSSLTDVVGAIADSLKASHATRGKVVAEDMMGIDQAIRLADAPDYFAEADYDDVAAQMTFELKNFAKSKIVTTLKSVLDANPIFSTAKDPDDD